MRITAPTITAVRAEANARAMQIAAIRPAPEGFSALLVRPGGPSAADVTITTPTLGELIPAVRAKVAEQERRGLVAGRMHVTREDGQRVARITFQEAPDAP